MDTLLAQRPRKPIGLTALIDVVFILLLFFMLTSSFSDLTSIKLNSANASVSAGDEQPALIVLHQDGHFSLNSLSGKSIDAAALRSSISVEQDVILLPQAASNVQQLLSAIELLKSAGFNKVTVGQSLPEANDQ